jgi:hypothetical protein
MNADDALQIINGLLLGDGCLAISGLDVYFTMTLSDKSERISTASFLVYLEHIGTAFDVLNIERTTGHPKVLYGKYTDGSERKKCKFSTKTNRFLRTLYDKWYGVYNGHREVPEDFRLTSMSLAYFYMSDGNLNVVKKTYSNRLRTYHTASFAANGFKLRSIEILEREFRNLGIGTYRGNCSNGLLYGADIRLYILAESLDKFKNIIRPYVVQPYLYKLSGIKEEPTKETLAEKLAKLKKL